MTDPEAVNRENDWWSNPRLEPILIGIYEDDMGDGYAKRLAAETALVELERERAALVAERDAAIRARDDARGLVEDNATHWHSAYEQAVAERDRYREQLQDARPYVYQTLHAARAEGQAWRAQTAEPILQAIDAALAVSTP